MRGSSLVLPKAQVAFALVMIHPILNNTLDLLSESSGFVELCGKMDCKFNF